MNLSEGQLWSISLAFPGLVSHVKLKRAAESSGVKPQPDDGGSRDLASLIRGTLQSSNGTEKVFHFLDALVRAVPVNDKNEATLRRALDGVAVILSTKDFGYKFEYRLLDETRAQLAEVEARLAKNRVSAKVAQSSPPVIFLSHVRAERSVAYLVSCLNFAFGTRIEIWVDDRIRGGKWRHHIGDNLRRASAMIVLGTPGILRSTFVGYEIGFADEALGTSGIFLLKAGVSTQDLQLCPPLDEFQNYESSNPTLLRKFLTNLGQEVNVSLPNLPDSAFTKMASSFADLAKEEASRR